MTRRTIHDEDTRSQACCSSPARGGASPALAQAPVEISFYYPVAVGGPITKIIDGFAADFEKENPGIKVKPIYSGTYQETIVKALTAHKSGKPPHDRRCCSRPTCSR